MTDRELEKTIKPILEVYEQRESELMKNIAKRFNIKEIPEDFDLWYFTKLQEIGELSDSNLKLMAKYDKRLEKLVNGIEIDINMPELEEAFKKGKLFREPADILSSQAFANIYKEAQTQILQGLGVINTRALESANANYMNILTKSYSEVASGTYSYQESIRKSLQQMGNKGITGATYQRGDKLVNYSIESAVRRETLSAVGRLANSINNNLCQELGADHVETSSHYGARPEHALWQGKVFSYPEEFIRITQYGEVNGLGGANCRHSFSPFFEGISNRIPKEFTEKENNEYYQLTQTQRKYERDVRKWKKKKVIAEKMGDDEYLERCTGKIAEKQKRLNKFVKENDLKKDYSRLYIQT